MSRFSTTVHIKNNVDRMRFVNTFSDIMKKRGFVPCSEDEAAQSYLLAFGEGWATLASGEYNENPQKACDDVRDIAAALNTSAFSVEVVDSDFALLKLCASNGGRDEVIVGDGSGYGIEKQPRGTQALWQPLLAEGRTWEQFTETAAKNAAFAEDTLAELAEMLGIEPRYICADFDDIAEKAGGNVTAVYFKKAAKAKSMSLNAAFKQVFGEALEPLGFKLVKSKYPYFARVVQGGEIIHVISLKTEAPYLHTIGRAGFSVLSGAATVYRPKIDLSVSPKSNARWLFGIRKFYNESNRSDFDSEFNNGNLCESSYIEGSSESLLEAMEQALKRTISIVIPVLEKIVDMDSCARFCTVYNMGFSLKEHFDAIKNGIIDPNDINNEGLLIMRIKDYVGYIDWKLERDRIQKKALVELPYYTYTQDEYDNFCSNIDRIKKEHLQMMGDVTNDVQFYSRIMLEMEKRKLSNTEILRTYGIDI